MHTSSINQSYRLVFNESSGTWVAAPETARGRGKGGRRSAWAAVAVSVLLLQAADRTEAQTRPALPTLAANQPSAVNNEYDRITSATGDKLTIVQKANSPRLVINWEHFSIGQGKTVEFSQPDANAIAVNRVTSLNPSVIEGSLIAEQGRVFILNPNGIQFTRGAVVSAAGLLASTHTMDNNAITYFKGSTNNTAYTLTGGVPGASVINEGNLSSTLGGQIVLLAEKVINTGTISSDQSQTQLLAGSGANVRVFGSPPDTLTVTGVRNAEIVNSGTITARNGSILLKTSAFDSQDRSSLIQQSGTLSAESTASATPGRIDLTAPGGTIFQTGTVSASGVVGGTIAVTPTARILIDSGQWKATSTTGKGGTIQVETTAGIEQTTSARMDASGLSGGDIKVVTTGSAWLSGQMTAEGQSGLGGTLSASGSTLTLAGASLAANGDTGGGRIDLGQWQGIPDSQRAMRTTLTEATSLQANATRTGAGGTVNILSRQLTASAASVQAIGGPAAGNGGTVTIASEQGLAFGGTTDTRSATGVAGRLYLVGRDLSVEGPITRLLEATPLDRSLGTGVPQVVSLPNGRMVVLDSTDSTTGNQAGAVRLYEKDGALVAVVTGRADGDKLGSGGITQLKNPATGFDGSSFVIASPNWGGDGVAQAGAATRVDGAAPRSMVVSRLNSLVGDTAGDQVSSGGVTALAGGHYVVNSPNWTNGSIARAGAATWRHGLNDAFMAGVVDTSNSLYGTTENYRVSSGGTIALTNGHYVVNSPEWGAENFFGLVSLGKGAVTWQNGTNAVAFGRGSAVSAANSLAGTEIGQQVGSGRVFALTNGNYVVSSPNWNLSFDPFQGVGAVTWRSGYSADPATPSASNSLIGSTSGDHVGSGGITPLANGNFVVNSPSWNSSRGAVTWSSGTGYIGTQEASTKGVVSETNSLVGNRPGDSLGSGGVVALTNGHYVVASPTWSSDSAPEVGAVTWRDGFSAGVVGRSDGTNSLVGTSAYARVGSGEVTALLNGNYVINSPNWSTRTLDSAGAVTWRSGSQPTSSDPVAVSASNSLVGTKSDDRVGSGGVILLPDGSYVVLSPDWGNGTLARAGAVTWRDAKGTDGKVGGITASNSLVGTHADDQVGSGGVVALDGLANKGGYLVLSPEWTNGTQAGAGAVTAMLPSSGKVGTVSASNSLVGSQAGDRVGSGGAVALDDGGFAVRSPAWSLGDVKAVGAITIVGASAADTGAVTAANSVVGSQREERFGSDPIFAWTEGRVLAKLPDTAALPGGATILRRGGNAALSLSALGESAGVSKLSRDAVSAQTATAQLALKAHNDLTVNAAITGSSAPGNRPVAVSLMAGRSVAINAGVTAPLGDVTVTANANPTANGILGRSTGTADLTMGPNGAVTAPAGTVTMAIDGTQDVGTITLAKVNAKDFTVRSNELALANGAFTAKSRQYDGTDVADVEGELTVNGLVFTNSNLLLAATGQFSSRHVANNKDVTVSAAITGFGGNKTSVLKDGAGQALTATTQANITRAPLTLSVDLGTKEYDGTVNTNPADVKVTAHMLNEGDSLVVNEWTATFDTKTAGTQKTGTVVVTNLTGAQFRDGDRSISAADNYDLTRVEYKSSTGTIEKRKIDATVSAQNKTYDGKDAATATVTTTRPSDGTNGFVAGDDITASIEGRFTDANAGTNKRVTFDAVHLQGADAQNYTLRSTTFVDGADTSTTGLPRGEGTAYAHIDPRAVTVQYWAKDKTYDGTVRAELGYEIQGKVDGDDLGYQGPTDLVLQFLLPGANPAAKVLTARAGTDQGALTGDAKLNYVMPASGGASLKTDTAAITPRMLDLNVNAASRIYDGTRDATITPTATNIVQFTTLGSNGTPQVTPDDVRVVIAGRFDSKNVGTDKPVDITAYFLDGTSRDNYVLPAQPVGLTASITPRLLNYYATASSKVYDGTTAATLKFTPSAAMSVPVSGLVAGDAVKINGNGTFASKNAGASVAVNIDDSSIKLAGTDSGNYTLGSITGASPSAAITPRDLKVTASVSNKVYDGTTSATAVYATDAIVGDAVSYAGTAEFSNRNAGTDKLVTFRAPTSGALLGADVGNYQLAGQVITNRPTITPAPLIARTTAPIDKVYDGQRNVAVALDAPTVLNAADVVTLEAIANFADKNAGTGKPLTWSPVTLRGTGAGNYFVQDTDVPTAGTIRPRAISVAMTASDKVYDGSRQATGGFTALGLISGDVVTASGTALFDTANAGIDKRVTGGNVALAGRDANNYSFTIPAAGISTLASIKPRSIDVTATASSRVYDGTTAANVTLNPSNLVAGDNLQATGTASFRDGKAGEDKPVTVSDIRLVGNTFGNYVLNRNSTSTRGTITPRPLDVTASVQDKVYDGTTSAGMTYQLQQVVSGDEVQVTGQAAFTDPNAGSAKPVAAGGFRLSGADSANYLVGKVDIRPGSITPRPVSVAGSLLVDQSGRMDGRLLRSGNVLPGDVNALIGTVSVNPDRVGYHTTPSSQSLATTNSNYMVTGEDFQLWITPPVITAGVLGLPQVPARMDLAATPSTRDRSSRALPDFTSFSLPVPAAESPVLRSARPTR